jgi:hypothetical protein
MRVETPARYRLLRIALPAPLFKALVKLAIENVGAAMFAVACGLKAARISQMSGSRKMTPMRAMIRLGAVPLPAPE